jgi:hypothetical protein
MPEDAKISKRLTIASLPRKRADGFSFNYANHTEAMPGFYELALQFCRIGKGADGDLAVEILAEISMSWEHAIRVKDLLNRVVAAYESENGNIRLLTEVDELNSAVEAAGNPQIE